MTKKYKIVIVGVSLILAIIILNLLLPYGLIPRLPSPNCGPEEWHWLGQSFSSKDDVVAYLQTHEVELLSGSYIAGLEGYPPDAMYIRLDVELDWQAIENDIQVERRLGYTIYSYTYQHPACGEGQMHTFKVTSFGFASLYGCCGI